MKKILSMAICVTLLAFACLSVSAAGLDANKSKVLESLKTQVTVGGKTVSLPSDLVAQAENFLKRDDVNITSDQADKIIENINEAMDTVKASGVTSISNLSLKDKTAILDNVRAAAEVVGLTVSVNSTAKIIVVLKDGVPVATNEAALKITGPDVTGIYLFSGIFLVLMAGCLAVALKARLFVK